ncbi:MAG: S-layer homology domain-containing protein, partial [Clostridia bacterium]|nr:S-layer homology domain-containing protein [Clostridia bacterium]
MRKLLCMVLTLVLLLGTVPAFAASVEFADLNGHWARNYVLPLAQDGVISGKAPGVFDPEANITRAEFVTLVSKLTNLHPDEKAPYADVVEGAWFAPTISAAKAYGVIDENLVVGGNFSPDAPITREEMTSVIVRLAEAIRGALLNKKEGFTDASTFAGWTAEYIAKAAGEGIVTGNPDGSFNAKGNATRAEAAVMIKRFRDLLNKPVRKLEAGEYHPSYGAPIYEVDLQKMIEDAYAAGQKSLTLEKGAYRLKIRTDACHLALIGMKDFTLDGNGSTLLCQSTSGTALTLTDCENVTVKNLNMEYEKINHYQALVTKVDPEGYFFEILVPNGYRDYFDDNSSLTDNQAVRVIQANGDMDHTITDSTVVFSKMEKLGNRRYRVNNMKITKKGIREGDWIAGGNKPAVRSAVTINNSKQCNMDNIGVWGGCVGIGMSQGYGDHHLNNYRVEPGPRPLGATYDRVLSTIADCAHINYMEVGPTIENSVFRNAGDDGFNCYGTFYRVAERKSDTELIITARDQNLFKEGHKLRIYSADGVFNNAAVVQSMTRLENYTPKTDLKIDMGVVLFVPSA